MPYKQHEFSSLIVVDPDKARAEMKAKFREAGALLSETAKLFKVSMNTLDRWIVRLKMRKELRDLLKQAKKEGWFNDEPMRRGGRPARSRASVAT